MSILRKKGQRALTHKQQRRYRRTLLTQRRWRAWRSFLDYTHANSRSPMDRAFRGIVGRPTEAQRDRHFHRLAMRRIRG